MSIRDGEVILASGDSVYVVAEGNGQISLPGAGHLFGSSFARVGSDLVIEHPQSADIRVIDYFRSGEPSDLVSSDGAVLRGHLVETLAGPETPGQYAQAGTPAGASPIGQVEMVGGNASVQRTDGVVENLNVGTKIFLNDVVESGTGGSLSITFTDGTVFTLSPDSRMIVDELVYDADGQGNSATFNLIEGSFVFIAGQVATTGGMDINTPAATMGIRGTTVLADVRTVNGVSTAEITLTQDPDGDVGRVALFDLNGDLITTITEIRTKWIVSTDGTEAREVERTGIDEQSDNMLLAEINAAYQSALARFEQAGKFVDLDNVTRGGGENNNDQVDDGIELDSNDDKEIPELDPVQENGTFDEGLNNTLEGAVPGEAPVAVDITLTGFEDLEGGSSFEGNLSADPAVIPGSEFGLLDSPANGSLVFGPDGTFEYVPEVNFNGTDVFTYVVTAPEGESATGTITINVLPVNDAPTISDETVTVLEDGAISGVSVGSDIDGDTLLYSLLAGPASGSASVSDTGEWVYQPDSDFEGSDSFEIAVTDDGGESVVQTISVVVTGTNDAPVVTSSTAAARGNITEGGPGVASGKLTASDADSDAVLTWTGSKAGAYGGFTILGDGSWTYTAGPGAESLAEGQVVREKFSAVVTDDQGTSAEQKVVVTLTGTNDGPVVTSGPGNAAGAVTENTAPAASGKLSASDADGDAVLTWTGSAAGTYGNFVIGTGGKWTYTLGPAAEALAEGQAVTETFTATVTDNLGATATQVVTITATGTNDGPVVTSGPGNAAGAVTENTAPAASGKLSASDADGDAVLTWTGSAAGTYGNFVIGTGGKWTYTLGPAAEALAEGQAVTETFTATVTDNLGATAAQVVTLTVTGTNDGPIVSGDTAGAVTENDAPLAAGTLIATDPDAGASATWTGSAAGTYGNFVIGTGGKWTYTLGPAAEALAEGQAVTETFTATVTDNLGATATQVVTLTVTGTNDGPIVSGDTAGAVTENDAPLAAGTLIATDPDAGASATWTGSAAGTYGNFVIGTGGKWTYAAGPATEGLREGQVVTETFAATATDDTGATTTQIVTINVTGTNDGPTSEDMDIELSRDGTFTGTLTAEDTDIGDVLTFTPGADGPDNGTVAILPDGSFTYTPGTDFQGLDNFDYVVTDATGASYVSTVTAVVESESGTGSGGQEVTLNIYPDPEIGPAGTVVATAGSPSPGGVNLVLALNSSHSNSPNEWIQSINAVADSMELLAAEFAGSSTPVEVHLVPFSNTANVAGTFDVTDPDLITTLRALPYVGAHHANWAAAFEATETFLDAQPADETNFLYMVTDGVRLEHGWKNALERLTDEAAKGYSVQIEAFGIGDSVNLGTLKQLDSEPTLLESASDLTDAFTATPLFSAKLVDLSVTLIADKVNIGEIDNENSNAILTDGFETKLSLADVAGIADLLGEVNRVSVNAGFSLDGDDSNVEIELFSSEVFEKAETSMNIAGDSGSDLLFGSDQSDTLAGNGGNDIILAFGGDDTISLGTGVDTVIAGAGNDRIIVSGADATFGDLKETIDAGLGRDVLDIDLAGDLSLDVLPLFNLDGIEAIDMDNGLANDLTLTLNDILSLSDEADTELESLLANALPESATIYGDAADGITLVNGASGTFADTGNNVTDTDGNTLDIFQYSSGSDVLATLAVDSDVAVTVQPTA